MKDNKVLSKLDDTSEEYIPTTVIDRFKTKESEFNFQKLVGLLEDLNSDFAEGRAYSIACMLRAVIDHIPPLFGFSNFEQVVANYKWGRSNQAFVNNLSKSRALSDSVLHKMIDEKEDIIDITDIPPKIWLRIVLIEALSLDKAPLKKQQKPIKVPQSAKKVSVNQSGVEISFVDNTAKWANYQYGLGFLIDIEIDNFGGKQDFLISAKLSATDSHADKWSTSSFVLADWHTSETESRRFLIQENMIISKRLFLLDREGLGSSAQMPDLDRDSAIVEVKLRSGKIVEHSVHIS